MSENCNVPYKLFTGEYERLAAAYDWFNKRLFDGKLPEIIITLNHRKPSECGFFRDAGFTYRDHEKHSDSEGVGEISLNPEAMFGHPDTEVMDTLVHEMAHVWQRYLGKPPRKAYHDKQWAAKMEAIGLMPSSTSQPGGKRTGQKMGDYVIEGGKFDIECKKLFETGWKLELHSAPGLKMPKKSSKVKFMCPDCDQSAWAKPGASLRCGRCSAATKMISENEE